MFRTVKGVLALMPVLLLAGCYSLSSAGGFPEHVRTLFIAPLENKTVRFELDTQIQRELNEQVPRALGVRQGAEKTADAVIDAIARFEREAGAFDPRAARRNALPFRRERYEAELFGFAFHPIEDAPVYHPDVRVWRVTEKADGRHVGLDFYDLLIVLLGHKITFSCRIVLWDHASPRQAHRRSASRHTWTAWRRPRGMRTGRRR